MKTINLPDNLRKNFLAADGSAVMSSLGDFFEIGETVSHQDKTDGDVMGKITHFKVSDRRPDEIEVHCLNDVLGHVWGYLDFIEKVRS